MHIVLFVYPVLSWWALGFSILALLREWHSRYPCTRLAVDTCFNSVFQCGCTICQQFQFLCFLTSSWFFECSLFEPFWCVDGNIRCGFHYIFLVICNIKHFSSLHHLWFVCLLLCWVVNSLSLESSLFWIQLLYHIGLLQIVFSSLISVFVFLRLLFFFFNLVMSSSSFDIYFFFFWNLLILLQRVAEKRRDKDLCFVHWLTP